MRDGGRHHRISLHAHPSVSGHTHEVTGVVTTVTNTRAPLGLETLGIYIVLSSTSRLRGVDACILLVGVDLCAQVLQRSGSILIDERTWSRRSGMCAAKARGRVHTCLNWGDRYRCIETLVVKKKVHAARQTISGKHTYTRKHDTASELRLCRREALL